ncbi:hypothetical protein Droror1_Dr00027960 [Drosera rotundifolia]
MPPLCQPSLCPQSGEPRKLRCALPSLALVHQLSAFHLPTPRLCPFSSPQRRLHSIPGASPSFAGPSIPASPPPLTTSASATAAARTSPDGGFLADCLIEILREEWRRPWGCAMKAVRWESAGKVARCGGLPRMRMRKVRMDCREGWPDLVIDGGAE